MTYLSISIVVYLLFLIILIYDHFRFVKIGEKNHFLEEKIVKLGSLSGFSIEEEIKEIPLSPYIANEPVLDIAPMMELLNNQHTIFEETDYVSYQIILGLDLISESLQDVFSYATDTKNESIQGAEMVASLKSQTEVVKELVHVSLQNSSDLNEKLKQIEKTLKLIDDISSKTNLLALNASIEAARAGDHGRGFKVVADEVKKLAELSSQYGNQISSIINQIYKDSQQSVESIKKSSTEAENSTLIVQQVDDTFTHILDKSDETNTRINELMGSIVELKEINENFTNKNEELKAESHQIKKALESLGE